MRSPVGYQTAGQLPDELASELDDLEWVEEGRPHRVWLAPASMLTDSGRVVGAERL